MSKDNLELRPDPYEGAANVDFDPSEAPGSFPFTNHDAEKAYELDVTPGQNIDGADFD